MRVLVGIVEDANHRNVGAADLLGDVAVKVLGRDDLDRVRSCDGHRPEGAEKSTEEQEAEEFFSRRRVRGRPWHEASPQQAEHEPKTSALTSQPSRLLHSPTIAG